MNVKHELTIFNRCPVNGAQDVYQLTVEARTIVKVEEIIAAVADLPTPAFQEELTVALAGRLHCRVTTIGHHTGVKTTCWAG
jgi:hypothetical protein